MTNSVMTKAVRRDVKSQKSASGGHLLVSTGHKKAMAKRVVGGTSK